MMADAYRLTYFKGTLSPVRRQDLAVTKVAAGNHAWWQILAKTELPAGDFKTSVPLIALEFRDRSLERFKLLILGPGGTAPP